MQDFYISIPINLSEAGDLFYLQQDTNVHVQ